MAELEGHLLVSENSFWEMYLNDETLGIIIKDKTTGEYMRSTVETPSSGDNKNWAGFCQSGVVLEYIQGTNLNMIRADMVNAKKEIELIYRENGFDALVRFEDPGISFALEVSLWDYGFSAEIPQSSIVEEKPDTTVGAIYVYPFMGHSVLGADAGYMLIPDGQGALIELKDNEKRFPSPFISSCYGDNIGLNAAEAWNDYWVLPEKILVPVYGMVHTDKKLGFAAIIESGAESATIEAWPNGASTIYDWISARFIYRHVFMQPTGQTSGTIQSRTERPNRIDIKMRFAFVSGDNAGYDGMAFRYRDYLTETGTFENAKDMSYRTQVDFFGQEKENWALFKLDVNMTDFASAANILEDLGFKTLSVYRGWRTGGYTAGSPALDYSPASGLGGKGGMKKLLDTAKELGDILALDANLLSISPDAHPFESLGSLKRVTGRTYEINTGSMVYPELRYLSPFKSLEAATKSNISASICLSGITSFLTAFKDGSYYDRADAAAIYSQAAEALGDGLVLDEPFAFLFKYGSSLVNMPTGGSDYIYSSREVPFLAIALSGQIPVYGEYLNFTPNQKESLLKLIEGGMRPAFLVTEENPALLRYTNRSDIYSSQYEMLHEQIKEHDKIFRKLDLATEGSAITSHKRSKDLAVVDYENGARIYVNFGDSEIIVDGTSVPALGWEAVR
ncbi:MAG: DUF5696 domain-containing protein [Clostridiales bacterium]|nr:DUF5696 domain-containing protein [Clostridiales bacterium]